MTRNEDSRALEPAAFGKDIAAGLLRPRNLASSALQLPSNVPAPRNPSPNLPGRSKQQPQREYTRPTYAKRFRCISSACEDTCCQGWSVPIDQGTYEKYRSTELLKPHLGTLIVLNTNRPTTSDYARIPLTAEASCSFLDTEKLCGIQKQLGPEMLSVTCATYPRAVSSEMGQVEEALNLSCPEAARLTLLDPNLLGDAAWRPSGAERYAVLRHSTREPLRGEESRLAIREFVLLQLRDRKYPIWQRLYLLGILARRLDAFSSATKRGGGTIAEWYGANPAKVARLLDDSARVAVLGTLRPGMDGIAAQPGRQLELLIELLHLRMSQPPVPARFVGCVGEFELGLGCATAKSEGEILDRYAEAHRQYYQPLMERHPHLIENYLANYVFKNSYPFGGQTQSAAGGSASAESEHLLLCVHAALAQTLLIGIAGHHRERFDVTHVVKLVQSLARTIEHSRQSIEQIKAFLTARDLNHLRGVALLLRQQ